MFSEPRKVKIFFLLLIMSVVFLAVLQVIYNRSFFKILPGHSDDVSSSDQLGIQRIAKHFLPVLFKNEAANEKLSLLAKSIYSAQKHVRGSKTSQYLKDAIVVMNDILKEINVDAETLKRRPSKNPTSVCSEEFRGGDFGFPLYHEGFVTKKCKNVVPLQNLITVVKYIDGQFLSFSEILNYISSVNGTYNSIRVSIGVDFAKFPEILKADYPWVDITNTSKLTEGAALNKLMKQIKTPYVLVARSTKTMTNDSRLERLIGEIESLDVVAAGGAFRYLNGHWGRGCFQTAYRNYTLKYVDGYDESFHECVFCDYIQGPFVTTTKYLKQNKFQNLNEKGGLYEDWFLRNFMKGQETVVCPDSMFYVYNVTRSNSDFKEFLKKWSVYRMFTPPANSFSLQCEDHEVSGGGPSLALSPCALHTNNNAVKLIMRTCEESGAICELQEGTALGAVKMGKSLPWEKDFDIRFLATSCSKCKELENSLKKAGLKFSDFAKSCCAKKIQFGERINVAIYYNGYYGDFTGHAVIDSDLLTNAGLAPTKLLLDGQWVNVPRNPGHFVRNRYGKEIYQHAEHWSYTGGKNKNHRMNYKTNRFLPCKYPGRHDCLDLYNGDGIIQFFDIYP